MTWVALFRGVNVGGHRKLPMAELRTLCETLGFAAPKTYIQSGNLVFGSDLPRGEILENLGRAIDKAFGFEPNILILSAVEFGKILAESPFDDATCDASKINIYFHVGDVPKTSNIEPIDGDPSCFVEKEGAHYIYSPDGLSKSKLAEILLRRIGASATGRNLRTCRKIMEMAAS